MMGLRRVLAAIVGALLLVAGAAASTAAGAADPRTAVQHLFEKFAAQGERRAAFVERRYSPLFRQPTDTRGTLYFKPPALMVREATSPRREIVRIDGDDVVLRIEGDAEGAAPIERKARLDAIPQLALLAGTLRALLAGDLATLERWFKVDLAQTPPRWTLTLAPIEAMPADPQAGAVTLRKAVIEGRGDAVERLVFFEASGDRTELTVMPLPAAGK